MVGLAALPCCCWAAVPLLTWSCRASECNWWMDRQPSRHVATTQRGSQPGCSCGILFSPPFGLGSICFVLYVAPPLFAEVCVKRRTVWLLIHTTTTQWQEFFLSNYINSKGNCAFGNWMLLLESSERRRQLSSDGTGHRVFRFVRINSYPIQIEYVYIFVYSYSFPFFATVKDLKHC